MTSLDQPAAQKSPLILCGEPVDFRPINGEPASSADYFRPGVHLYTQRTDFFEHGNTVMWGSEAVVFVSRGLPAPIGSHIEIVGVRYEPHTLAVEIKESFPESCLETPLGNRNSTTAAVVIPAHEVKRIETNVAWPK